MECLNEGKSETRKSQTEIISSLRPCHKLEHLLKVAKLARSTYFYHLSRVLGCDKYSEIKQHIKDIFKKHKGCYGYRRITFAIKKFGISINHKLVMKLMRDLGLKSHVRKKKYRSYKGKIGKIADNIIERDFTAKAPNTKWVTDVTEFNVRGEKLYLSPIMDLFNGEIISYATSIRPTYDAVKAMLQKAIGILKPNERPLLHSDQGWQYQMPHYQETLKKSGLTQSMSRKGNCLDNAAMESFFAILKTECFHSTKFTSISALNKTIKEYIYYYNNDRIKVKLNGLSPVQYRTGLNL